MHTKARHAAISFEVVEWSEQLRSVISVWLGAAVVRHECDYAQAGEKGEWCLVYISPRDLLRSFFSD